MEEPLDQKRLLLLLSGTVQREGLRRFDRDESVRAARVSLDNAPAARVFQLAISGNPQGLGAKSAVVELDYYDRDTNVAYVQMGARAFRDYPRRTFRIHFFKDRVAYRDLLHDRTLQRAYLGFCVLSPADPKGYLVSPGTLGKTVLAAPPGNHDTLNVVPVHAHVPVNMAGVPLVATGTAFIQQDDRISACASAALWMATYVLGRRFNHDTETRSIAEITQLATKFTLPSGGHGVAPGLDDNQMMTALREMGYEPVQFQPYSHVDAKEMIFQYIDSGIPVILIIGLPNRTSEIADPDYHALTVVGFTDDPSAVPHGITGATEGNEGDQSWWYSCSEWSPEFIVHDDLVGPYLQLSISGDGQVNGGETRAMLTFRPDSLVTKALRTEIEGIYSGAWLEQVFASLPPRNLLQHDQAAGKGIAILQEGFRLHSHVTGDIPDKPVYRTYLTQSSSYRSHFRPPVFPSEVARWYRGTSYPRYVWVTELCSYEQRSGVPMTRHEIIADVALDPTSAVDGFDFVSMRLPRCFFRTARNQSELGALRRPAAYFRNDHSYPAYTRIRRAI